MIFRPSVVYTFLRYEIKRSVARKKVIVLAVFTFLIGTSIYFLLDYVGSSHALQQFLAPYLGYIWVVGVFLPQAFFVQFTALLIAGGAMSEEYEAGTAELLLSKPVTKAEYFVGKFIGGYLLLAFIIGLNMILAVASATVTFGSQVALNALPVVFVAQVFAAVLFFTVAFMFGEVVRRSSLSYIISSAAFITSGAFGLILGFIYNVTSTPLYREIQYFLPTSAVTSLPALLVNKYVPSTVSTLLGFLTLGGDIETSVVFSIGLILLYSAIAFVIAFAYFEFADVSRKAS
ncbi:MAG: ABC transporter permease [Nitrososphaerales archaeon]